MFKMSNTINKNLLKWLHPSIYKKDGLNSFKVLKID